MSTVSQGLNLLVRLRLQQEPYAGGIGGVGEFEGHRRSRQLGLYPSSVEPGTRGLRGDWTRGRGSKGRLRTLPSPRSIPAQTPRLSHHEVRARLLPILTLRNLKLPQKRLCLLDLYAFSYAPWPTATKSDLMSTRAASSLREILLKVQKVQLCSARETQSIAYQDRPGIGG